jgi:hypothetical protein
VVATAYSFAEACAMLGISAHTLRRRIRDGVISAERVERPQGYAWHVFLERADVTAAGSDVTTDEPAATRQSEPAPAGNHVADGERLALALAQLVEAAVAPFRGELADVRAQLSARDQEVGQLRERNATLEARVQVLTRANILASSQHPEDGASYRARSCPPSWPPTPRGIVGRSATRADR